MTNKIELRRIMRQKRHLLSHTEQESAALLVCTRLIQLAAYHSASNIGAYLPFDNELDPRPIIKNAWNAGKTVSLPCLTTDGALQFKIFKPNSTLKDNRFMIPEPQGTEVIPTEFLQIILVPLVAFDANCNRLGLGAGYYDKTAVKVDTKKTLLIGLAYEFQRTNIIEIDQWDIAMSDIITDFAHYSCTHASAEKKIKKNG